MTQPVADITTAVALLQTYAAGRRDFANLMLSEADLAEIDLKGADLTEVNLHRGRPAGGNTAILIGTNLQTAKLAKAVLAAADYDPHDTHFPEGFDPVQEGLKSDR